MPQGSRLAPPRLGRQERPVWGSRRRNIYRRPRGQASARKSSWRRLTFLSLGLLGLTGLSLGLLVLYYQLLTCSFFCIKDIGNIEIEGTHRLSHELVLELTGLGPHTNLLALRPGRVEQALVSHPWIAQAELTRKWPQRLHLRIREREPVALVQMGELYYVDRQGRLFKPLSPGDPHDFPVITGLGGEHFPPGDGPLPEALGKVLTLLDLLKEAPPPLHLENIAEVHVDQDRGLTLYANGLGSAVHLGWTDFPEKLNKFARVWPLLTRRGLLSRVERINLDYPQKVLLSQKGAEEKPVKP